MDNQNLQANGSSPSKSQNKEILQANKNSAFGLQNKKILQESMEDPDKNLSKVFICHRLPERTFKVGNRYFPVCSRCTGMYIGAFSYYIFVYFVYVQYNTTIILAAVLMILPTFSDGLTQFFGFRESNNVLRFFTGLIAGVGLGILVKSIKYGLLY
ncbi:DUF2085 domain-containing protein [Methanobacterium sp.]|uniref:DUF2085 domain-containing protein n=1 Tax=Methanobacterium sp. TaxID=2164 RepID=UPI003C76AF51